MALFRFYMRLFIPFCLSQVETESGKKVGDNLERISADMRLLKEENVTLTRQLKL